MNIDIKDILEKVVDKIKDDPQLLAKFKKDPVSVVEKLIGIDLPNDELEKVVYSISAGDGAAVRVLRDGGERGHLCAYALV